MEYVNASVAVLCAINCYMVAICIHIKHVACFELTSYTFFLVTSLCLMYHCMEPLQHLSSSVLMWVYFLFLWLKVAPCVHVFFSTTCRRSVRHYIKLSEKYTYRVHVFVLYKSLALLVLIPRVKLKIFFSLVWKDTDIVFFTGMEDNFLQGLDLHSSHSVHIEQWSWCLS
jgi:hypothetical protein